MRGRRLRHVFGLLAALPSRRLPALVLTMWLAGAAACGGAPPAGPSPAPTPEASVGAVPSPALAETPDGGALEPSPALPAPTATAAAVTAPPYVIGIRSAANNLSWPGFAETPDGIQIVGSPAMLPTPLLGTTVMVDIVRIDAVTGERTTVATLGPVISGAYWGEWSVTVPPNPPYWVDGPFEIVSTATLGSQSFVHTRRFTVDATPPAVTYTMPTSLTVGTEVRITPVTEHSDIISYRTWSSGRIPRGLMLDHQTGVIFGTPKAWERAETLPFEVKDSMYNVFRIDVSFPPVKLAQVLRGFGFTAAAIELGEPAPAITTPAGAAGALSYRSETPDVCVVDGGTGALRVLSAGTCRVTANAAATDRYSASTASTSVMIRPRARPPVTAPPTCTPRARSSQGADLAVAALLAIDGKLRWSLRSACGESEPVGAEFATCDAESGPHPTEIDVALARGDKSLLADIARASVRVRDPACAEMLPPR